MDLAAELSSLASHLFRGSVCAIPFNRETSVAAVAGLFFSAKERCVAKLERWKVTIFFYSYFVPTMARIVSRCIRVAFCLAEALVGEGVE